MDHQDHRLNYDSVYRALR